MLSKTWIALLGLAMAVTAMPELPQQTESPSITQLQKKSPTTTLLSSTITSAPQSLHCTNGSTAVTTTDCTYGGTYSFCYKAPPPLTCSESSYPSSYDCGECEICTGCFPVNATYLTTTCSNNGEFPYTTNTIFNGTLAGGTTTTILQVQCECHSDQWYSWGSGAQYGPYCMPKTDCASGMTTSTSTDSYCLTSPTSCSGISTYWPYCVCAEPNQTPVYPSIGAYPTGCASVVATSTSA